MENPQLQILLVGQNKTSQELFQKLAINTSYSVFSIPDYENAIHYINEKSPQLVFTELNLGEHDGIELIHSCTNSDKVRNTVFAIYTTNADTYTEVIAFNSGADDYISGVSNTRLLNSKIKALSRRLKPKYQGQVTVIKDWVIDPDKFLVFHKEEKIELQKREFEIINLLSSQPEKVFSREEIKKRIWGNTDGIKHRTIDVHIRKLRMKVGEQLIQTVKGVGYKI